MSSLQRLILLFRHVVIEIPYICPVTNNTVSYSQILSVNNIQGNYGFLVKTLSVGIELESNDRVHVKITDASNDRWEIPSSIIPLQKSQPITQQFYSVKLSQPGQAFSISIIRLVDNVVIFQSADLQFSDQYLVISNIYPVLHGYYPNVYGLGEHVDPVRLSANGHTYTMWNVDIPTPFDMNLYGSHPFYLQIVDNGNAHGMYLHNSNGLTVAVNPDRVTYKTIGGVLDFFIFTGPTPESVTQQYHNLIGLPHFPPYWSLGWHQCRYGYKNLQEIEQVVANYSAAKIPLDTMWNDIDYMDQYEDFSWDPVNYPEVEMAEFVNQLHANGQQYVVIVDPGIHNRTGYGPFEDGLKQGIFITESDGKTPYIGQVWPGTTAFPDFSNPATTDYWLNYMGEFLSQVAIDGLWIDMNEVSNFIDGEATSNSKYNNPPYSINNFNSFASLNTKTLPMDALHYNGVAEYNIHNLYGLTEAITTNYALEKIQGRRSFILSRSTFPSSGAHTAHWLGDNHSTFADLAASIAGILNFNMFGIPLAGVDICGFIGDTTEELCNRWTALGAFYPFSRNHNAINQIPQEPYRWASVANTARTMFAARYSLLPYLYTQFYTVNQVGGMVAKPVFFVFPTDTNTWGIDQQFLLGPALLITPVMTQGMMSVTGYFPPAAIWFDFWTGLKTTSQGWVTVAANWNEIGVHIRGGSILVQQEPALTTRDTRKNPFFLTVAPDVNGNASGNLFWDDGENLAIGKEALISSYTLATTSEGRILTNTVTQNNIQLPTLNTVSILGVTSAPSAVTVNGQNWTSFIYNSTTAILTIGFQMPMIAQLSIKF